MIRLGTAVYLVALAVFVGLTIAAYFAQRP